MKWEDIVRVNGEAKTTDIKGKDYVMVHERVKAFRKLYPEGVIEANIISLDAETCVIKADVYSANNATRPLATGIAKEDRSASNINKYSYVENCQTSAIGRALGFVGIGIDTGIASYEEVRGAEQKAEMFKKIGKIKAKALEERLKKNGQSVEAFLAWGQVLALEDLTELQLSKINEGLNKKEGKENDGIEVRGID